ncbi:hypothetical protein CROQUDRAFT_670837 [Cronartium quercuum f. sp. fusiforme G11]|uniref:Expansin-like EG45 domain-containing protein n=1 Tax=Cronartium quercuum f. sp. fusiforme G11 TaxID=708437 RepID=A0A9P6NH72_9BASI|nr:hypothetical protein CROQUDRAFT_670837 [Cronartium quercuum f. sp. fusiforme G11]
MISFTLATPFAVTTRSLDSVAVGQKFTNVQGTFWQQSSWGGECLFQNSWPQPTNLPYVALAVNLYGQAEYCGACIKVTPVDRKHPPKIGIINTVCANCPTNALDMGPDLYNSIMGNTPGRPGLTHVDWEIVECPLGNSNMRLISKDGASQWHFSLQVASTITPVTKVEARSPTSQNKWLIAKRKEYNYWELAPGDAVGGEAEIRVTCSSGRSVIIPKVKIFSSNLVITNTNC